MKFQQVKNKTRSGNLWIYLIWCQNIHHPFSFVCPVCYFKLNNDDSISQFRWHGQYYNSFVYIHVLMLQTQLSTFPKLLPSPPIFFLKFPFSFQTKYIAHFIITRLTSITYLLDTILMTFCFPFQILLVFTKVLILRFVILTSVSHCYFDWSAFCDVKQGNFLKQ